MKNNDNNKILTLQEMQNLFCDYVFEKLSDEERQSFENSLFKYPDLIKELEDVKLSFSKLPKKSYDKKISSYTRNLSVKVNEKISVQSKLSFKIQRLYKYLIPASGLAVILIIVSYFNIFEYNNTLSKSSLVTKNKNFTGINQGDIDSLISGEKDSINYLNEIDKFVTSSNPTHSDLLASYNDSDFELTLTNIYNDILSEQILQDGINISKFDNLKQYDLYKNIENLEKEDIENILEELENADFNT